MQNPGSGVFVFSVFVALSFLFSSCGLREDDGPTPGSYEAYVKVRNYYPAFSPDGKKIVYCHLNYEYPEPADYPSGLYIIDSDGGNRTKILEGSFYDPAWSPDGEYLVFSNQGTIQKCKVNGDEVETFTGLDTLENPGFFFPDWSPDGKYIVFDSPFRTQGNAHSTPPGNFTGWKVVCIHGWRWRSFYKLGNFCHGHTGDFQGEVDR